VLGMPELAGDPRFADGELRVDNEAELLGIVRPAIAEKPTAYWSERLREADIMHERLNTFREFVAQPQAEATNLFSWLQLAGISEPVPIPNVAGIAPFAESTPRAVTPVPGQHTREILADHGFRPEEIAALMERGVATVAAG